MYPIFFRLKTFLKSQTFIKRTSKTFNLCNFNLFNKLTFNNVNLFNYKPI